MKKRKKLGAASKRPRLPILTPFAMRMELAARGSTEFSPLDRLLNDDQARALERWAICAQLIEGKAKTVNYSGGGTGHGCASPIPDDWVRSVGQYVHIRSEMKMRTRHTLRILDAFSALQNNEPGALSLAGYGIMFFPNARHKRDAFLNAIREAADVLVRLGH